MERVLITGSNGQLGSELKLLIKNYSNYEYYFTDKDELDICDKNALISFIEKNKIKIIINAAAYTNVEDAEIRSKTADAINYEAVKSIGELVKEFKLKLIHISTDYVFDGVSNKGYKESDTVNPINVYGITKSKGERALLRINPANCAIIRTSWLYSQFGSNFVKTMLKLLKEKEQISVVSDQVGSPTYANNLADVILNVIPLLKNDGVEVYHYTNSGACSWFDFANEIKGLTKSTCKINSVTSEEFKAKATRPKFSLLNTEKIQKDFQIEIPFWKDSLKECLIKMNEL